MVPPPPSLVPLHHGASSTTKWLSPVVEVRYDSCDTVTRLQRMENGEDQDTLVAASQEESEKTKTPGRNGKKGRVHEKKGQKVRRTLVFYNPTLHCAILTDIFAIVSYTYLYRYISFLAIIAFYTSIGENLLLPTIKSDSAKVKKEKEGL